MNEMICLCACEAAAAIENVGYLILWACTNVDEPTVLVYFYLVVFGVFLMFMISLSQPPKQ